jgi:hypothetical protein
MAVALEIRALTSEYGLLNGRRLRPKSKSPTTAVERRNDDRCKDSLRSYAWAMAIEFKVTSSLPTGDSLDLPKAISDLDSAPLLMAWGNVLAGAVAFTFGADGLSLGGLGGLGGLGAVRFDKPIAAAKIEFMPSSFYQQQRGKDRYDKGRKRNKLG